MSISAEGGVRISEAGAAALKEGAQQRGILLSLHAPYFIFPFQRRR